MSTFQVQRRELPGQVVGLEVGRRGGRDQADVAARDRVGGQQRDGLEQRHPILGVVQQQRSVGDEDRVEFPPLRELDEPDVIGDVVVAGQVAAGTAPGGDVMACRVEVEVEVEPSIFFV
ncbi:hypothetical protein ABT297_20885 [Dactylosporangium sp. NPDC000555]|uniref:hypothetical protein n=1 Tax=Dactylosporangium sp. NPDC000555 TaxID=3154260 RepID=UPI003325F4AC